ncbi:MAG: hypothetical protein M1829_003234 [Trizodia sp. TS-e1964]|nr:MAG: hypothetical protein M1829_003234 [Trizodia sp. TS-e1964]
MSRSPMKEPQWPPRSPHEALLASPGGRDRLRCIQNRTSPSPSPLKKSMSTPLLGRRPPQTFGIDSLAAMEEEDGDEEDEETLELQLKALEAKIKLRKLRQAKAKSSNAILDIENNTRKNHRSSNLAAAVSGSSAAINRGEKSVRLKRARSEPEILVPVSPPRNLSIAKESPSPSRVLLGIDKGLRGRDISLRRPPAQRKDTIELFPQESFAMQAGRTSNLHNRAAMTATVSSAESKPKSFSERIAESRANDRIQKEREVKIRRARSTGFGVDQKEVQEYKTAALSSSSIAESRTPLDFKHEFTRDQVLQTRDRNTLKRSKTVNSSLHQPSIPSTLPSRQPLISDTFSKSYTDSSSSQHTYDTSLSSITSAESTQFDPFSTLHLSKRILPHTFLTRNLSDKEIYLIPDLLKVVKAPNFETPDTEKDFVVLGVLASKSAPRDHKEQRMATEGSEGKRGKYMVLCLTDLKWEIDLFLFATGFDKYWKLTLGTVIAILNPAIMPPPPNKRDNGKFSLTLSSSDDTILEIGTARDLGFCKSVKRDGKTCDSWIDNRHTEFCTYHIDAQLQKTKSGRMEVNTMDFGPGKTRNAFFGSGRRGRSSAPGENGLKREGAYHDRSTNSHIFIAPSIPSSGRSTASLLDDVDIDPNMFHRGSTREERLRRRLAERERERDIARKLADKGNGAGAQYLRAKKPPNNGNSSTAATEDGALAVDVHTLGLSGGNAGEISLSPLKRRKGNADLATAVGWSGAFKRAASPGILREPTAARDEVATARKKTRFITANGIREAGRESLGAAGLSREADGAVDDDDGLDIYNQSRWATQSSANFTSGYFHADEALAIFLLRMLPDYTLLRTRDPALLSTCHTIVDVGSVYDPKTNRYDHHQRAFSQTFPNRLMNLSSAGLVYLNYGKAIIVQHTRLPKDSDEVPVLFDNLYTEFVEALDAHDNGISAYDSAALQEAGIKKRFSDGGVTLGSLVKKSGVFRYG